MTTNEIITLSISGFALLITSFSYYKFIVFRKQDSRRYLENQKTIILKECDTFLSEARIMHSNLILANLELYNSEVARFLTESKKHIIKLVKGIEETRSAIANLDYKFIDTMPKNRNQINSNYETFKALRMTILEGLEKGKI